MLVKQYRTHPNSFYLPTFHVITSSDLLLITFLKQGQIVNFLWSQIIGCDNEQRQKLLLIVIRNITFREIGCDRIYRLLVPGAGLDELFKLLEVRDFEDIAWNIVRNLCFNPSAKTALLSHHK